MYFPVPRLTTSPATMIISICSSEMKRPPTQNWLKNCDFRKIFKIASKTVTFERSLKLAQRLWLLNIPKFWNGLEWWWKIAASLLFCFLEGVYAWYFMPSWKIMYDRSYYDFCMLAVILSFGILPMVSQMSLYRQVLQCLWSFLSRFVMSPKNSLVRSHFVPPHACFFLLFKSQLKTKISANQKLWPIETLPTVSNVSIAVHNEILCKVLQSVFET